MTDTSPLAAPSRSNKLSSLLRQRDGQLTRQLLLTPGGFGLGQVPTTRKPDAVTRMVCGFCSTGCSLDIHLKDGQAVSLTPTTDYSVNLGMACPKGWEALTVLNSDDRATTPLLRRASGRFDPVDWDTALRTFCERFRAIQAEHGPESIAFLSTGQIPTEEMALLGSLFKFGMGGLHGDGNTRQCMATSVVAYKQAFGFDAPPYCYQDFAESDVLVLIGANLCIAHPIMWEHVVRNPHHPEIVVVDPRATETAMSATQHLAIQPKSDLELLYGIAHILIEQAWIDREFIAAHTTGFEEFAEYVKKYTPEFAAGRCGLTAEQLQEFARTIHAGERVSFWWTMGVNQSYQGVRTAQAIINLALMTGNIGRPGTGANSITGQCNAMGSRLFSNTTNLLGGHDFLNAEHRQKVARALGLEPHVIPDRNSWAYHEILEGILRGKIKGLWVIATNPAHSWINQKQCLDVLDRLEFLVVQDMYSTTETARLADLVLPAAAWGEKDGTFINSERRIGVVKKVSKAPGQALSDFAIFKLVAEHWGCGEMFREWDSPESVFQILKRLSHGQPCDITGITDYRTLDAHGGIQWPFPAEHDAATSKASDAVEDLRRSANENVPDPGEPEGLSPRTSTVVRGLTLSGSPGKLFPAERLAASPHPLTPSPAHPLTPSPSHDRRLFTDGRFYHADGRAKFLFEDPKPLSEPPSDRYPLILLTGRGSVSQWHTQTRTKKSAVLRKLASENIYVEINPDDARKFGIQPNQWVQVESQRGSIRARSFITQCVQPGQVFVPMHYETANQLTDAVFDPYSKQPSYKACAVRIQRAD